MLWELDDSKCFTIGFMEHSSSETSSSAIVVFICIEWVGRENEYAIENFGLQWWKPVRLTFYYFIVFAILFFQGEEQQFIYFQF